MSAEKTPGCENCEAEGHGVYHAAHGPRYPRQPIYRGRAEGSGYEVWIEDDGYVSNGSTVGTLERKLPDGKVEVEPIPPVLVKALRFWKDQYYEMERRASLNRPRPRGDW